ncbi:hypothetical protein ACHAPJ_013510 [Fusarium lateritium]
MAFSFSSFRAGIPGGVMTIWATLAVLVHVPAISAMVQQVLTLTFGPYLPSGLINSNLPVTSILTFAVLRRRRLKSTAVLNPTFIAWLSSMLLELEWLTSQCHNDKIGWYRAYFFTLLVGQLGLMLWVCLGAANRTLPIAERQNPEYYKVYPAERRRTQPVYFVSSPAFGPAWLVPTLYRAQEKVVFLAWRAGVWVFVYAMRLRPLRRRFLSRMGKSGVEVDDDGVDFHEIATRKPLRGSEYTKAMQATRRFLTPVTLITANFFFNTELRLMVLVISMAMSIGLDTGFIWNILEMVCHFALEIDGEYFELKRVGDSVELSRKPVAKPKDDPRANSNSQEPERIILSHTYVGCSFMTKDEIEAKGKHLIAISPSYDAIKYNCQGLRDNLFKRILDDRAAPAEHKRRNLGWGSPHASFLELMIESVFFLYYDLDMSATTVNMADSKTVPDVATAALPLLWVGFAIFKLINSVCGIVWSTSTIEGEPFRLRVALPQLLAPMLILRALPVITRKLSTVSPAKQTLWLLTGLRYTLMLAHYVYIILYRRTEYTDNSFVTVEGGEPKPAGSVSPAEAVSNDLTFDTRWKQWISRHVLVQKIEPVLQGEERGSEALPWWSSQLEGWEKSLLVMSIIITSR